MSHPTATEPTDDELRDACTRFLALHGRQRPSDLLAEAAERAALDRYGEGGSVAEVERRVAELLGMPAAVFMPSGTMAQQITLRIHADRRGRRVVAFHPMCHLEIGEGKAYERLHGLIGRPVGDARRLLDLDDLTAIAEPLAAVVFELPQRSIGGRLPAWGDLAAQVALVRERGAAVHLDGARLWEAAAAYDRPLAEVAALFDTVYVSFYKGLGGLSGCCLAGPADVVAEAREWRQRHGGTLFALWPYAASALAGLDRRLPRMPDYVAHARAIARAVRVVDGVAVVPDPPDTAMMHLHLRTSAEELRAAVRALARDDGIWTFARSAPTDQPTWVAVELCVGDATLSFSPEEVTAIVERLVKH
jgi:threonine aldolase